MASVCSQGEGSNGSNEKGAEPESAEVLRDLIRDAETLYWDKANEVLIFGTIK